MMDRRTFLAAAPMVAVAPMSMASSGRAMTPDERIASAIEQIAMAFREKYPNCPIRVEDCDNGSDGMLLVLTYVGNDEPGSLNHKLLGSARRKP